MKNHYIIRNKHQNKKEPAGSLGSTASKKTASLSGETRRITGEKIRDTIESRRCPRLYGDYRSNTGICRRFTLTPGEMGVLRYALVKEEETLVNQVESPRKGGEPRKRRGHI